MDGRDDQATRTLNDYDHSAVTVGAIRRVKVKTPRFVSPYLKWEYRNRPTSESTRNQLHGSTWNQKAVCDNDSPTRVFCANSISTKVTNPISPLLYKTSL